MWDIDRGCGHLLNRGWFPVEETDQMFLTCDVRRLWNLDNLPSVRCLMVGPRWMRSFGVEQLPIAKVQPPWWEECRVGRRWVLVFSLEDDVQELVQKGWMARDELRPGVFAAW